MKGLFILFIAVSKFLSCLKGSRDTKKLGPKLLKKNIFKNAIFSDKTLKMFKKTNEVNASSFAFTPGFNGDVNSIAIAISENVDMNDLDNLENEMC
jgi:hypothetical protein